MAGAEPTSLADLPEDLLRKTLSRLDPRSRTSLFQTYPALRSPQLCTGVTIRWSKDCSVAWPQLGRSAPLKQLKLVGVRTSDSTSSQSHSHSELDQLSTCGEVSLFLHQVLAADDDGAAEEAFKGVLSLTLQDWDLTNPPNAVAALSMLLGRAFPALTHIRLDRCTSTSYPFLPDLLAGACQHLTHLTHLDLHNTQGRTHLPPNLSLMTQLTSLSLVTPHRSHSSHSSHSSHGLHGSHWSRLSRYAHAQADQTVHISPLAALVNLQQLELALPNPDLTGLAAIGRACTQLTQLRFVQLGDSGEDSNISGALSSGVAWPHLVEAHVLVPAPLLPQLGLHTRESAPSLQRLHLHLLSADSGTGPAIAACAALQQPLVVAPPPSKCGLLGLLDGLFPLADRLQHLVLHQHRISDDPEQVRSALNSLPRLTNLAFAETDPKAVSGLVPLLSGLQHVVRVVIGLRTHLVGGNKGSLADDAAARMWFYVLHTLLQPDDAAQGQQQQGGGSSSSGCSTAAAGASDGVGQRQVSVSQPQAQLSRAVAGAAAATAAAAPAGPPVHIYFGAWCPASDINHWAVQHNPHYLQLKQLADQSSSSSAAGRFRLHECDGGSASDMALGRGGAWLEEHLQQLRSAKEKNIRSGY